MADEVFRVTLTVLVCLASPLTHNVKRTGLTWLMLCIAGPKRDAEDAGRGLVIR